MEYTLVIDTREKKPFVDKFTKVLDINKISWRRGTLSVGDFVLMDNEDNVICMIEHKSYGDFVQSIVNGHLESQLTDMDKSDVLQYVFIDGTHSNWIRSPSSKYCKTTVNVINGFKIASQRNHKASIVQFDTTAQLLKGVVLLINQLSKSTVKKDKLPERTVSTGNPTIDLLLSIDGIGIKTAERIYEKGITFGYIYAVCHRLEPDVARDMIKATYGITVPIKSIEWIKRIA